MTLAKSLIPHHEYRTVLMDFREQLFHRLLWTIMIFIGISINLTLLQQPRPFLFLGMMLVFMLVFWQIRSIYASYPNIARYLFVIMLYVLLFCLLRFQFTDWTIYLILPTMLVNALLMSNSTLIGALSFCIYVIWTGETEALMGLIILILINYVIITLMASTFNTVLSWYSSMHHRADTLLQETRDRRAELVGIIKSLETAYQTQRRLQSQLIYARQQAEDARRMKERFASNISHELRTPLNIILGFSEIMYLTPEVYGDVFFPPKLHRDIYQIHHNSKHLLTLIDDVLDLSHIELSEFSLNFEVTHLDKFLSDTVDMLVHYFDDSSVQFIIDIPDNLPVIEIDRTRIRQVFINLITNARRFTEQGYVKLSVKTEDSHIKFIFEDTGRGIASDKINLIFEEFYQVDYSLSRQHGGAGLGLAITRQFVEAHNGILTVSSELYKGSIFTVALPIREQSRSKEVEFTAESLEEEQETVLFVDSDQHSVSFVSRHLEQFTVIQVADSSDVETYVLEYNPIAIIHNRLPKQHSLESLTIPIIECTLPTSQWLSDNLDVERSLAKPISIEQLANILQDFPNAQKLLIVDDEIGFVQLIQRSLESMNKDYLIRRAYDGIQAFDIIQQDTPDLIFLDLSMPEMNGFELVDLLKTNEYYSKIPIILLTATRYMTSDEDWLHNIHIHQKGGFHPRRILAYIKVLLQ